MTSKKRQACEEAIRTYMEGLDHAALARIRDADQWACGLYRTPEGACCLVGHGEGLETREQYHRWLELDHSGMAALPASSAYEALCHHDGADRTIAAIQHYAEHLLGTRLRSLLQPALCPLAAREEAGV